VNRGNYAERRAPSSRRNPRFSHRLSLLTNDKYALFAALSISWLILFSLVQDEREVEEEAFS
jgi:hypothetical protein